jgi:hypothetical protein
MAQTRGHILLKWIQLRFEYIIALALHLRFIVCYLHTTVLMAIID